MSGLESGGGGAASGVYREVGARLYDLIDSGGQY